MGRPNDVRLVVQRGINVTFLGESEAAIPWIEEAMRRDPFSTHRYDLDLVCAPFIARRPAGAVAALERTTRLHWEHYLWAAASNAARNDQRTHMRHRPPTCPGHSLELSNWHGVNLATRYSVGVS